jgi:cell division protein FtsW (lipid II flippase)
MGTIPDCGGPGDRGGVVVSRYEEQTVVAEFLDRVCSHVRAQELHADIREELSSHIAEQIEILQEEGVHWDAAASEAIRLMGDPDLIGRNLHKAHKPVMEWKLLSIFALMVFVGIFGTFSVQQSGTYPQYGTSLLVNKLLFTFIGLVGFIIFYFMDYRKIQKYSGALFFGTLLIMAYTIYANTTINGSRAFLEFGPIGINVMAVSLLPLLLSLAGMKQTKEWRGLEHLFQLVYRGALPTALFCLGGSSWFYGCIYLFGFFWMTWITKKNLAQFLMLVLPLLSLYIMVLPGVEEFSHRLDIFLHGAGEDGDYRLLNMKLAIHFAGWMGKGFAAKNEILPNIFSESLFPYLIYCFGWGAGILVAVLILWCMVRFWKMRGHIREEYAKRIWIGFMAVFGFRMLWPLLMFFGYVPFIGEEFPFIGYGGGAIQIFDFAAAGLLLSIFRRKNMIPREMGDALQRH